MKQAKLVLVLLISIIVISLFMSCKNKTTDPTEPSGSSGLVGTWKLTKLSVVTSTGSTTLTEAQLALLNFSIIFELKSDNTYVMTEVDEGSTTSETGSWQATDKTLTVTSGDITQTFNYTLSGNKLSVSFSEGQEQYTQEYTRQ